MSTSLQKSVHLLTEPILAVMTFCAATPPLEEVLKLWEWVTGTLVNLDITDQRCSFLFCHGAHLNILFVIAQMDLCSQDIMNSPS